MDSMRVSILPSQRMPPEAGWGKVCEIRSCPMFVESLTDQSARSAESKREGPTGTEGERLKS
jgi:hypothetical protein